MKLFISSLLAAFLAAPGVQEPARDPAPRTDVARRFLARSEPAVAQAIALRHLVATTRGGSMRGWVDACTELDDGQLRYWIVGEGGSGAVRKRALIAALDGEVKARKENVTHAALDPSNYEFAPEVVDGGLLRVGLTPKRKETMLIEGAMFLSPEDADLIRLEGRVVKPPSFWTRQVNIVRRYARTAGVRVPMSVESTAKILVVGTSTFAMTYRYLSINGQAVPPEPGSATDARVCDGVPAKGRPMDPQSGVPATTLSEALVVTPQSAVEHHEKGVDFHLRQRLGEASAEYAETLALDPPREPTAAERRLAEGLVPRVFVTASEPFALRDFAVVMNPDARVIAYHFFWDDDIDFPDDNEPSDHELVWVRYTKDGHLAGIQTYFHGRVIEGGQAALDDAAAHGQRPAVYVQWGKHGSMPAGWQDDEIEPDEGDAEAAYFPEDTPITLERFNRAAFEKLSKDGARHADHPLARQGDWPARFAGSWTDFSTFPRAVDALALLESRHMLLVSRWNSATINQRFLRYNFKPKLEWPDED